MNRHKEHIELLKSMDREKHKEQVTLTFYATLVVFCTVLITLVVASIIMLILFGTGLVERLAPTPFRMLLVMVAVSTVIGFTIAAIFGRYPTSPINNMIRQIDRLGSGDFKARLRFGKPASNMATFVELENSFNKMAAELENTEMLRNDFINNFSHEFKTPIVSIAGFAKLLRKGNLSEEQKEEYLEVIEAESMRLSNMATNVLNMSRLDNMSILSDTTEFNLSEQLRSCILLFERKWEEKKIDFTVDFDEYEICANKELLKQVWINLIDNALKFAPIGGMISFRISEFDDYLSVTIGNTGPDIPEDLQKRIFNKFYQADESHSTEGNGIGLAIVKRVTELHHGIVQVSSEGGFTKFTVTLPKNF